MSPLLRKIPDVPSPFPPPYTLQVSSRAKYPRLKMVPHKGLIVVVPQRFPKKEIAPLLERHKEWIQKVTAKINAHLPEPDVTEEGLPENITFPIFNETWHLTYKHEASNRVVLKQQDEGHLLLVGEIEETALCCKLLTKWLNRRAEVLLQPRLTELATSVGMRFSASAMRCQKSRWGSCSSKGAITLNSKLLFLPEELVRHVMLHELCHTLHMNHSAAFWAEVARFDPLWKQHKIEMKSAWKYVPSWIAKL